MSSASSKIPASERAGQPRQKQQATSSSSALSSRQASQTSLQTSSGLGGGAEASMKAASAAKTATSATMSRGSSALSVALSDTQVSVSSSCTAASLRGAASSAPAAQQQPLKQPAKLKKSSSSLSSSSASAVQKQRAGLSFSGIRRPGSGSAAGKAKAAPPPSPHSAKSLPTSPSLSKQRVPTLAMSLRDKDQQIKLLIKERAEQKFQAELMAKRAEEWREKFEASELERTHMTSEADDEVVELRRLAQEFEDENKRLAERLAQREQLVGDTQFKLNELECEREQLRRELADRAEQLEELEQERCDLLAGARSGPELITERQMSKAKYEREIDELNERLVQKDESMMQLRSSLEMRKNEVNNLQLLAGDLERKLKIESERSERHLKRIDEINLQLRAAEEKLTTKTEENEIQEKQVKQLRQEVRTLEDKLEQLSLARKKDVDILHNKLSAARGSACRSATPTGANSPAAYKTPTPQDEIVRLQMELRDLKDQLIDREAELDCNRRDLEVMRRKMETRTLEVDCNNQELARRCQDLLEQNRQSEDTVKQLLKSTTEHSAQLVRATEDLKEANAKCIKLREEVNELEAKLDAELQRAAGLQRENEQLKEEHQMQVEQIEQLRQQVDTLNEQLGDLCEQLDIQTQNLHKDREMLADQLSEHEINSAQMRHDLATAKQDLRTNKLQTQEVCSERDRLKSDLDMKDKYIRSRNDIIEQMRHELDDSQKSLADYKAKLDSLRNELEQRLEERAKESQSQVKQLRLDLKSKSDECVALRKECQELEAKLAQVNHRQEQFEDEKFDEMRRKHSQELDKLRMRLAELELQIDQREQVEEQQQQQQHSAADTRKDDKSLAADHEPTGVNGHQEISLGAQKTQEYETQIEFLNSLVVDMQRRADGYKNRLASIEAMQMMGDFAGLEHREEAREGEQVTTVGRSSTLKRGEQEPQQSHNTGTIKRHVRIQDPVDGQVSSLPRAKANSEACDQSAGNDRLAQIEQQLYGTLTRSSEAGGGGKVPVRHISGRPFCDICQVYDLHHTIYCHKVNDKLNARHRPGETTLEQSSSNNNNNNYYVNPCSVDEMFREYEESLESAARQFYPQFASLGRPTNNNHQVNGHSRNKAI